MTGLRYRADIDGLRAIAVALVVAYHSFPSLAPGGFTGVDVFFVISGYLITSILENNIHTNTFSIISFYRHRIRRILPALNLLLLSVLVFGWVTLLPSEFAMLCSEITASALFFANVHFFYQTGYFDTAAATKPLLHIWSLGVEEQYYLFWPILMWISHRARVRTQYMAMAVIVASFATNLATVEHHQAAAFFLPMARLWELGLGALLACWQPSQFACRRWHSEFGSIAGTVLVGVGAAYATAESTYPGLLALFPTIGAALLIWAGPQATLNRVVLASPIFVGVGLVSYPLYLWHWPLLSFGHILAGAEPVAAFRVGCVVVSVVLAYATYRVVETPVRRTRGWPVPIALLAGATCAFGLSLVAPSLPQFPNTKGPDVASIHMGDGWENISNSCYATPGEQSMIRDCYMDSRGAATNAVWGDSHANALMYGLVRSTSTNERWIDLGAGNCPPMSGIQWNSPGSPGYDVPVICRDSNAVALKVLERSSEIHSVVLVAAARIVTAPAYGPAGTKDIEDGAIVDGIVTAAVRLHAAGKAVYFLVDNPSLPEPQECLDRLVYIPRETRVDCEKTLAAHLAERADYLAIVVQIKQRTPFVTVVDPTPILCPNGVCPSAYDGRFLYFDGDHLSDTGSSLVAKFLIARMREDASQ